MWKRLVVAVALASTGAALVVTQAQPNAARQSSEQIVKAIEPAPFKAGLPFREPPVLRSSNGRLRGTLVAQTGPIEVSGIRVENAQSYALAGQQRGLLGPTLHARPGDLVDLVLDNELVQPQPVPGTAGADLAQPMAHGECGHDTTIAPGEPQPTNFHFHGLHVTPRNHKVGDVTYYGDNVLVCLRPGERHIRFRIPRNHDLGAFWYHAHLHGLTDDQVYRGLAGLLTIGDARRYLPTRFARVRTHYLSLKDIQVRVERRWARDPDRPRLGQSDASHGQRARRPQADDAAGGDAALARRQLLVGALVPHRAGGRQQARPVHGRVTGREPDDRAAAHDVGADRPRPPRRHPRPRAAVGKPDPQDAGLQPGPADLRRGRARDDRRRGRAAHRTSTRRGGAEPCRRSRAHVGPSGRGSSASRAPAWPS